MPTEVAKSTTRFAPMPPAAKQIDQLALLRNNRSSVFLHSHKDQDLRPDRCVDHRSAGDAWRLRKPVDDSMNARIFNGGSESSCLA